MEIGNWLSKLLLILWLSFSSIQILTQPSGLLVSTRFNECHQVQIWVAMEFSTVLLPRPWQPGCKMEHNTTNKTNICYFIIWFHLNLHKGILRQEGELWERNAPGCLLALSSWLVKNACLSDIKLSLTACVWLPVTQRIKIGSIQWHIWYDMNIYWGQPASSILGKSWDAVE